MRKSMIPNRRLLPGGLSAALVAGVLMSGLCLQIDTASAAGNLTVTQEPAEHSNHFTTRVRKLPKIAKNRFSQFRINLWSKFGHGFPEVAMREGFKPMKLDKWQQKFANGELGETSFAYIAGSDLKGPDLPGYWDNTIRLVKLVKIKGADRFLVVEEQEANDGDDGDGKLIWKKTPSGLFPQWRQEPRKGFQDRESLSLKKNVTILVGNQHAVDELTKHANGVALYIGKAPSSKLTNNEEEPLLSPHRR